MNRKTLSPRQLQVMEILWEAKEGMTASAIVKSSPDLQINTVQASLRSLVAKKYVQVGDIVYSGTVLSRSYIPLVSREEYLEMSCRQLSKLSGPSLVFANFIQAEKNEALLDELEEMIQQRKKELKEGE